MAGLITDYLSYGSGAPSGAPDVVTGEYALYQDTATGDLYVWNLDTTAWDAVGGGGGGGTGDYILIRDEKSQGTAGGTFTSGSWQTRVLNTEVSDAGGNASLSSNQITLAAGTYRARILCPARLCAEHQARLYNTTDAAVVLLGTSQYAPSGVDGPNVYSEIIGRFTIGSGKALEVQHKCATSRSSDGFGTGSNLATEIFTVVELIKE